MNSGKVAMHYGFKWPLGSKFWKSRQTLYRPHGTLTHWVRVTHICVGKLSIISSDNGLSPGRRQAIIWTNDGILSIGPLGTNFSEILIEIQTLSLKKMRLKMSSAKCCPFRFGLNVLIACRGTVCERQMQTILQTTFSYPFLRMKIVGIFWQYESKTLIYAQDKMLGIMQMTFLKKNLWLNFLFPFKILWNIFLRIQSTSKRYRW